MRERRFNPQSGESNGHRSDPNGQKSCNCGCQPKYAYAAELAQDYTRLLPELSQFGEMICFVRNQHCILGSSLCLPDMEHIGPYYRGSNQYADIRWDTSQWDHTYTVHETHVDDRLMVGMESFDQHHRALCRIFLAPDSEVYRYRQCLQAHVVRDVPEAELASWYRVGDLRTQYRQTPQLATEYSLKQDPAGAAIPSWEEGISLQEQGYPSSDAFWAKLFRDAVEAQSQLILTVAGKFGRMSMPFYPSMSERNPKSWLYVGGSSQAMHLYLPTVTSIWIGMHFDGYSYCSYVEALDAFGNLALRVTSTDTAQFRHWQRLACGGE